MSELLSPGVLSPRDEALVADFRRLLAADPLGLGGPALTEAMSAADRVRSRFDGACTALTGAWAESLDWACSGYRSPVSWLTSHTETPRTSAAATVKTARSLRSMPATAAASAEGSLGSAKVRLLSRARTPEVANEFDAQEEVLVRTLQGLSVDGASTYLEAWRLRAMPDGGGGEAEASHEADEMHVSPTFGGHHAVRGGYCATDGAILTGALDAEIDSWHRQGRLVGDTRTRSHLRAAALIAIVQRGVDSTTRNGDVRPLVIAVVEADLLAGNRAPGRGVRPFPGPGPGSRPGPCPGERPTGSAAGMAAGAPGGFDRPQAGAVAAEKSAAPARCELHGVGPVPVETVRRLLCEGDVCRVVMHGASMPLDVGRRYRLATADQWRALLAASGGHCEWPGCDAPADWCQVHHFIPWDDDGTTDIANLGFVCSHHHHACHEGGHVMARGPDGVTVTDRQGFPVRPPPLRHRLA